MEMEANVSGEYKTVFMNAGCRRVKDMVKT